MLRCHANMPEQNHHRPACAGRCLQRQRHFNRQVFAALGDEGWFYGDFFIHVHVKETESRSLVYEGIYRYVNNPDVLLGKLWLYGLALATMRMEMGVLAFFCHAVAWFFLMAVEERAFYHYFCLLLLLSFLFAQ